MLMKLTEHPHLKQKNKTTTQIPTNINISFETTGKDEVVN